MILDSKILEQAINVTLTFPCSAVYLENLIWLLTNLTRAPFPEFKKVSSFLPLVEYLIGLDEVRGRGGFEEEGIGKEEEIREEGSYKDVNERILEGAMQVFYNICSSAEVEEKNLREILDMQFNILDFIISFVSPCAPKGSSSNSFSIRLSQVCTKILGVLLTGDDKTTQELINLGALHWLIEASKSECKKIRKDAFWSLSNVACCEEGVVGLLYEEKGEIPDEIYSDPARLRQVLINLMSNAMKYTSKGWIKVNSSIFLNFFSLFILFFNF